MFTLPTGASTDAMTPDNQWEIVYLRNQAWENHFVCSVTVTHDIVTFPATCSSCPNSGERCVGDECADVALTIDVPFVDDVWIVKMYVRQKYTVSTNSGLTFHLWLNDGTDVKQLTDLPLGDGGIVSLSQHGLLPGNYMLVGIVVDEDTTNYPNISAGDRVDFGTMSLVVR